MEKNFEFDDVDDEELDFVQSREKIPVTLHITAINKYKEKENKEMKRKIMRFIIKHNTLYRFFSKFEWCNSSIRVNQ